MKKVLLSAIVVFASYIFPSFTSAQSTYKTAVGLGLDFGKGTTSGGPTIKHFFDNYNALQGEIFLGDEYFSLGAYYQYHQSFKKFAALKGYIGLGPELFFSGRNNVGVALRPMAGLDYKIQKLPLSINFDFRPALVINNKSEFEAAHFGLGVRYIFK